MNLSTHSPGALYQAFAPEEARRILNRRASYDGKRLASFRRVLGTILVVTGAPVFVLSEFPTPTTRRAITVLALMWLGLVLPMVRLLCVEWQNNRRAERLRVLIHTDD